jgi:aquaporin Z
MEYPLWKRVAAECFGTFCLVFAGTGAIVVNDVAGGVVTHVGIAATFGLVVFTMIASVGDVSGAHLNPAVTLGFFLAKRMPGNEVAPFAAGQILGAVIASLVLRLLFADHASLGATFPSGSVGQSLVLETILTTFLMFVILSVTTGAKEKGITAGMAIGGVVALAAMFGGPISGASMNPARSLGPALVSGELAMLWIYMVWPVLGAGVAVLSCRCVREPGCCDAAFPEVSGS